MLHIKLNGITNAEIWEQIFCLQIHPTPTLREGIKKRSKFNFSENGHAAYQIKRNHECSNMVANILPADSPLRAPTLGVGSKGQNSTFSEHAHVAYQIEWNDACSNMVADNFTRRPPSSPPSRPDTGIGKKGQNSTFSEHAHVAYQIQGNDACSRMVANIFTRRPP